MVPLCTSCQMGSRLLEITGTRPLNHLIFAAKPPFFNHSLFNYYRYKTLKTIGFGDYRIPATDQGLGNDLNRRVPLGPCRFRKIRVFVPDQEEPCCEIAAHPPKLKVGAGGGVPPEI